MRVPSAIILLLLAVLLWGACNSKDTEVNLRLTPNERTRIDTIYTVRLDSLRPIWDSLCEMNYPQMVEEAVDSIVQQRLEEETRLRSRLTE